VVYPGFRTACPAGRTSEPGRLVRYVIARDPHGIYKPAYLFCTDPAVPDTELVEEYARRWPLEVAGEASKQKLGIEHPRTQLPTAVRRSAPFGMLLYSLTTGRHLPPRR